MGRSWMLHTTNDLKEYCISLEGIRSQIRRHGKGRYYHTKKTLLDSRPTRGEDGRGNTGYTAYWPTDHGLESGVEAQERRYCERTGRKLYVKISYSIPFYS